MEITYYGHSTFKLKGKSGTVVTDPFLPEVGWSLPTLSADLVTVSHDHFDHNAAQKVNGTARRPQPFIVSQPGEYEVGGISVFGTLSYHDNVKGAERGVNTIQTIIIDDVRICHLGDLGHELTSQQLDEIGVVDVLLCPVGGTFTIDPKLAIKTIQQIEPSYAIPMHYKTAQHSEKLSQLLTLEEFLKEYGVTPASQPKVIIEKNRMPEETELIVLDIQK